ncbi:MAG: hypothetical protein RLZZ427_929 [Pseudomonadota bacterium]|jgi:hypothetical protein
MVFHIAKTTRRAALAAALIATAALPSMAHAAGSSSGSGQAALTVGDQCVVEGANVDLGTFTTTQTWGDVDATLGFVETDGTTYHAGTRGVAYADFGSVTCDKDVEYTLQIAGTGFEIVGNGLRLVVSGRPAEFVVAIKEIGGNVVADSSARRFVAPNAGQVLLDSISATGTGAKQHFKGSLIRIDTEGLGSGVRQDTVLGEVGSFSGKINYTLTF